MNVKVLYIGYNLFDGTETLSLSVYEITEYKFRLGGQSPQFGGGVELGVGCATT